MLEESSVLGFTSVEFNVIPESINTFSLEGNKEMIGEVEASIFTSKAHKHVIVIYL